MSLNNREQGFGLIELIIAVSIMAFLTTVVVSSQNTYSRAISLRKTTDEIELRLRQAQVYGIAVREFTPGSAEFDAAYGLSFNIEAGGSNNSYVYFADRAPKNERYDSGWACPVGGASECLKKEILPTNVTVTDICYIRENNTENCTPAGVDITFSRPETRAKIKFFNSAGSDLSVPQLKSARITLSSSDNQTKNVFVYANGQISVQ